MTMHIWISELQAFSIPTIAIGTACVAIQQYRIAKQKLRFDLYAKRLAIYESFHDSVVTALNNRFEKIFDDTTGNLGIRLREARFLFDSSTFEYLNKLDTDILSYRHSHLTINNPDSENRSEQDVASRWSDFHETSKRLLVSLQKLPSTMHPYMSIDDRLSFSAKPSSEVLKLSKNVVLQAASNLFR